MIPPSSREDDDEQEETRSNEGRERTMMEDNDRQPNNSR
jgi:hypothetical protein